MGRSRQGLCEERTVKQYIVDTFTDKLFSGNPAAVCIMEYWPEEELMQNIAKVHVLMNFVDTTMEKIYFHTLSGELAASRKDKTYEKLNVVEAPVCGSGHCHIIPY